MTCRSEGPLGLLLPCRASVSLLFLPRKFILDALAKCWILSSETKCQIPKGIVAKNGKPEVNDSDKTFLMSQRNTCQNTYLIPLSKPRHFLFGGNQIDWGRCFSQVRTFHWLDTRWPLYTWPIWPILIIPLSHSKYIFCLEQKMWLGLFWSFTRIHWWSSFFNGGSWLGDVITTWTE